MGRRLSYLIICAIIRKVIPMADQDNCTTIMIPIMFRKTPINLKRFVEFSKKINLLFVLV